MHLQFLFNLINNKFIEKKEDINAVLFNKTFRTY